MELQHSFTVPVAVPQAWALFNDVEQVAPCFPGAMLTSVEGDEFAGTAKVKLGPVSLTYAGTGRFLRRDDEARTAVIEAAGKDKRGNGTAAATVTAHMEAAGEGNTRVVLDTDLKITGRPAQFGRGMISDVGGRILDQFAACLESRLEGAGEPAAAEAEPAAVEPGPAGGAPAEPAPEPAPEPPPEPAGAEVPPLVEQADEAPRVAPEPASLSGGSAHRTAAPRLRPVSEPAPELDLGALLVPPWVKQWGPLLASAAVAAVVVAVVARWASRRR